MYALFCTFPLHLPIFFFKDRHHHFPLSHSRYVLLGPAVRGSGGGVVAPQAASETFLGQSSR